MKIRAAMSRLLRRLHGKLNPPPDQSSQLREAQAREKFLTEKLAEIAEHEATREADRAFHSMVDDLVEARALAGAGPWRVGPAALKATEKLVTALREGPTKLREDFTGNAQGAYGDIELALMTIDWRREINFSVLQFSRWGIQQIILVCRLYWLKNPIVRRLVNVVAAYVFARGVEVTTSDETANDVWKDFCERNRQVMGQVALVQQQRSKATDGNLFWCFFPDKTDTGKVSSRMIDATEINEIRSNPDDCDEPWFYMRCWVQASWDPKTNVVDNVTRYAWYPAMGYEGDIPETIGAHPVIKDAVIYHRKCGYVGKWTFGCPEIFSAIDWAKEARRYLEACASVAQQLAQIALTLTTKGGQQALTGAKQQLGTTVGPPFPGWDTNPPAVAGGIFAAGTGTKLEAFKTQGAGCDPEKVRQYKLMCAMVAGVPETFLGDVSTGNLATATTLDRPTETVFLERQEEWREDLTIICKFVLRVSAGAANGKLQEAGRSLSIVECARKRGAAPSVIYEAFKKKPDTIEIQVNFPAIREGDMPARVNAIVAAMTLGNKAGQIIGIDEKVGVTELYRELGIEDGDEIAESQYNSTGKDKYDPNRAEEILPAPIEKPKPVGGVSQIDPATGQPTEQAPKVAPLVDKKTKEALVRVSSAITELVENGHSRR